MASDPIRVGSSAGPFSTSNRFFIDFFWGPFLDPLFFASFAALWTKISRFRGQTGSHFGSQTGALSGSAASSNPRPVKTLKPLFLHMFQALGAFPKTSFWRSKSSQNWYQNWSKNGTLFWTIFFAGLGRKRPFQGKKWAPFLGPFWH